MEELQKGKIVEFSRKNKEIDLMADHFSITDEEIKEARRKGTLVCYDKETGVELWQELWISSKHGYERHENRNAPSEIVKIQNQKMLEQVSKPSKNFSLQRENSKNTKVKNYSKFLKTAAIFALVGGVGLAAFSGIKKGSQNPVQSYAPVVSTNYSLLNDVEPEIAMAYASESLEKFRNLCDSYGTSQFEEMNENLYQNYYGPVAVSYDDYTYYVKCGDEFKKEAKAAKKEFEVNISAYESQIAKMGDTFSFANSSLVGAQVVDGEVYVADSLENYKDGELPENSEIIDGCLYVRYGEEKAVKSK